MSRDSSADEIVDEGQPPSGPAERRRMLELELAKIRSEAKAARLEAKAVEIELLIRRLSADSASSDGDSLVIPIADAISKADPSPAEQHVPPPKLLRSDSPYPVGSRLPTDAGETPESRTHFSDWGSLRAAMPAAQAGTTPRSSETMPGSSETTPGPSETAPGPAAGTPPTPLPTSGQRAEVKSRPRFDSGHVLPRKPHLDPSAEIVVRATGEKIERQRNSELGPTAAKALQQVATESGDESDADRDRKPRPAGWIVSAIGHFVLIAILAMISLRTQRPKDQVALSASAAQPREESVETFTIESQEQPEVSEPVESEPEHIELSPIGELAAVEFKPDPTLAPPSPAAAALSSGSGADAAMSLSSATSEVTMEFCGVEGGGNHFVYLVDSSGSMGEGFESAREELLRSIDLLKPDQRFYVVFFDAEPDYMRLADAEVDEPRSAYATPENKAALKRWAARIRVDAGRHPRDPLRFALKLRPDVIFLLSDGEFPQHIEDLLNTENRVTNLFGETHPISIVHTIGYHSKDGESRMRRIAKQNEGQYRYVPKP